MPRDPASREGARALRLFVAVDVPNDVRRAVASAVGRLREVHPRARWVPIENQHVTLKFLGATSPSLIGAVTDAIEEIAVTSATFAARVEGLGAFPNERRAHVLWAGLDDADGRMVELAGALDDGLRRDFPLQTRAFTPHLTVARFEPPVALGALPAVASEPFAVDRVVLFRSHLGRPAPVYEPIATFPLGG
jgi:RNA 2',3'-cyclic 3'-phosphodiesterase